MKAMATVTAPRSLTVEEYCHMEEVLGFRDELIEGERVSSPCPILPHTAVIERLEREAGLCATLLAVITAAQQPPAFRYLRAAGNSYSADSDFRHRIRLPPVPAAAPVICDPEFSRR
jgi:hypothetical protein